MSNFYQELKRRNVVRVGLAYLVVGWVVVQVVNAFLPTFGAPDWVQKTIMFLIIIGFPIALILAWAFELTAEGIEKTVEVTPDAKGFPFVPVVLVLGLMAAGGWYYFSGTPGDEEPVAGTETAASVPLLPVAADKSIAVLPFVDMSAAGDQEYLGDGITEEILNVLAQSRELRVVGRTSSFAFKGQNQDLRAIGEALGVAYILEGSVRKAGERVRVTAQLVKASDGFHLWSDSYDRTLDDIFALQDDIAAAIAGAMETSLDFGGDDLAAGRSANPAAHEMYLQGLSALKARGKNVAYAIALFNAATELDPEFASAWSSLAFAYNQLRGLAYFGTGSFNKNRQTLIEQYIEKALALNPRDVTAHHLKANLYRADGQWLEAESEYDLALRLDPQSAAIYEDYTEFLGAVGRLEEALVAGRKSYQLDPLTPLYISAYADAMSAAGDYAGAEIYHKLALEQDSEYGLARLQLLGLALMQGRYDDLLEVAGDPLSGVSDRLDFFRDLAAFGKGERPDVPAVPSDIVGRAKGLYEFWIAIVQLNVGSADAFPDVILRDEIFSVGLRFFAGLWEQDGFRVFVTDRGLLSYWRESGHWGDMCRPLGPDDFECGVFE